VSHSGRPKLIDRAGNVSAGAKDMLEALRVEWVQPDDLHQINGDSSKVSFLWLRAELIVDIRVYDTSIFIYGSTG